LLNSAQECSPQQELSESTCASLGNLVLEEWFLHSGVHQTHLEVLLKHRPLGSTLEFLIQKLGWSPEFCVSITNAAAAGLGYTLRTIALKQLNPTCLDQ
jgi:hypothetical protein